MLGFNLIPNKEKMDGMTENSVLRAACTGVLHNAAFDYITSPLTSGDLFKSRSAFVDLALVTLCYTHLSLHVSYLFDLFDFKQ